MTTKELESRVRVSKVGSGQYRFFTTLYGKEISTLTNDSVTYDRITEGEDGGNMLGMTYKQALQYAHDIVVGANKKYECCYSLKH